jgi:VWFA-related protein
VRIRIAGLLFVCLSLRAQAPDDTPTFRANTQLVQVDVIVKAKDVPVTGLTKDDFEIYDNGKAQQISVFSVRQVATEPFAKFELPPGIVSNRPLSRGTESVSATVILFDAINTMADAQGYTRIQALRYLDKAARNEVIAVYLLGMPLKVLLPFTDNRARIRELINGFHMSQSLLLRDGPGGLLEGIPGNAGASARLNNLQLRVDFTKAALESLARHLKGLPGRKKLVWITAGVPPTTTFTTLRNGIAMHEYYDFSERLYAPAKAFNDANVAVYPIDPRGVMTCGGPDGISRPCGSDGGLADPGITTMLHYAQKTGGKALYNDNGVAELIDEAMSDTDLTYTLGFYSTEETRNARQHNLRVRVKRAGVETRYRQAYSGEGLSQPVTKKLRDETLNSWMQDSVDATEIPLLASAFPSRQRPGYYDVAVKLAIDGIKLEEKNGRFSGSVEIGIAPLRSNTKGLRQTIAINLKPETLSDALNNGLTVLNRVRATDEKGKLLSEQVRVTVMDNATLRTGSVAIPLEKKQ